MIIIIPLLHTIVSIIIPGIAWKTLLNHRLHLPDDHGTGYILQIIALGILFNTIQFAMALLLIKFHASQQMIAIGKYAMDLVLIIFASLKAGYSFTGELKKLARVWAGAGGKLVFIITVMLGLIAILHFPHVGDSGQLLWTNKIIQTGFFPVFKRFAIGYSALIYFLHFIVPEMSLPTLAAGFKLPLLLLAGLVAGWVVNRLQLKQIGIFRTLFFFIMTFSIFGLYGMLELGKDSAWGVLQHFIYFLPGGQA